RHHTVTSKPKEVLHVVLGSIVLRRCAHRGRTRFHRRRSSGCRNRQDSFRRLSRVVFVVPGSRYCAQTARCLALCALNEPLCAGPPATMRRRRRPGLLTASFTSGEPVMITKKQWLSVATASLL